jgi:hypothetical protein
LVSKLSARLQHAALSNSLLETMVVLAVPFIDFLILFVWLELLLHPIAFHQFFS